MENKLKINILNIIVTKDCNLECKHCMRGNHSQEYISLKIIENLLSQVREIGALNITGGEPFLAPMQISYIVNYIKENNIKIDVFSIITNGTIYNINILNDLATLSSLTTAKKYKGNAIGISEDNYHNKEIERLGITEIRNRNHLLLEKFCQKYNITFASHNIADNVIIQEGRGKTVNSFKKEYVNYIFDARRLHQYTKEYDGEIIIDPHGSIFISSDVSYETIEKYSIGNINDENLYDILLREYNESIKIKSKLLFKN